MELRPKKNVSEQSPFSRCPKAKAPAPKLEEQVLGIKKSIGSPKAGMLSRVQAHPALRRGVDEGLLILSVVRVVGPCG